jgi:hypothetical protein
MTRLACNPERLALLARRLNIARGEISLQLRLAEIGDLAMPEIRSLLQRAISLLESQEDRVRRILNSSFLNLSDSYSLTFNSSAYLLNRWVTHHPGWWSDATHGETTEIDILIAKVAGSPFDAGRLIDSTSFLAPLIYGCNDTEVVRKLWLSATDPRTTSVTTAGQRITRLVEEVFGDQEWREGIAPTWVDIHKQLTTSRQIHDLLGEVVAPWQLQFTGLASEWSWSAETGIHYLKKIADAENAAMAISQGLGSALYRNLSDLPDDSSDRLHRIDSIAFAVGASTELLRNAKVRQADMDSDHLSTLLTIPALLPLKLPWPTSLLIGKSKSFVVNLFDKTPEVRVTSAMQMLQHRSTLASIAYMAVFNSALTSGRIDQVNDRPSPDVQLELQHTVDLIDNPTARGQVLADLSDENS